MALSALIGASRGSSTSVDLIAELAITMAPVMEEQGVIPRGEIDPAHFTEHMVDKAERLGRVVVGRSEISAWSRGL